MCGHHAQNLFVLRYPQLSGPWRSCGQGSVLYRSLPARTSRSMSTVYRRYTGFSPASKGLAMLSQSKHWSGGCRVCRTCSAAHGCFLTMLINCLEAAPACCLKTLANYHQWWIPLGTRHCREPFYLISAVQHTNFLTVPLSMTMWCPLGSQPFRVWSSSSPHHVYKEAFECLLFIVRIKVKFALFCLYILSIQLK